MKLLLDTCALLWLARDPAKLSEKAREAISTNRGSLYVSAISAFEIGTKHTKGGLEFKIPPKEWWEAAVHYYHLHVVDVSASICLASTALPLFHKDPCDRGIIATAAELGAGIVTSDGWISQYPEVRVVW